MTRVFGDYRLKMAEDKKSMKKADVKPGGVEEQQSRGQASAAVVIRKDSDHFSEAKPKYSVSSGNSFSVDLALSEIDPRGASTHLEAVTGVSGAELTNVRGTEKENRIGALSFAASRQEPNSAIPAEDCPLAQSVLASQHKECTADPHVQEDSQTPALQKPVLTQMTGNAPKKDRSQGPKPEAAPGDDTEKAAAEGTAQNKKKKKKQNPSASKKEIQKTEINRGAKAETNGCQQKDISQQNDTSQQSEDQLWKEVAWCVEQLELGLKTQKPTAKQAEEALRAIRTLRNDKAPLVKKRQLMRTMFGDYRKKMEEERCRELKLMEMAVKSAKVIKVKRSICNKSCQFIRKSSSACRKSQGSAGSPSESPRTFNRGLLKFTTPQEEFRFNFL